MGFVEREWIASGAVKPENHQEVADYMYQIFARDGTTEYAPMMNFTMSLNAHVSLGVPGKVCDKDYPLPLSFIYGDHDWVQGIEGDIADEIMSVNQFYKEDSNEFGLMLSRVHIVPTSDHNMHTDNPTALANTIINDIYDRKLPVLPNKATELLFEDKMRNEEAELSRYEQKMMTEQSNENQ